MTAEPGLSLDHVVIAAEDLDGAESEMTRLLGRRASWRGRHPLYGTANVLYRLDEGAYLELLGVDPDASVSGAWTEFLKGFLLERGPGIFSIALQTPDVAATVASVRARGLKVDEPLPGEGVDLQSGAKREWTNARVPPGETGGTAMFFIEHRSPPDALPMAPLIADDAAVVKAVGGLTVETADMASATKLWHERVGLPQGTVEGGSAFHLGNAGLVVFSGVGEGTAPHRWMRLVLSRRGLTSLADRLDGAGVHFEQGDFREGYGIRCEVSGADVLVVEGGA
jgi:catechol 2,3-dioxygenase-like lactoylglutathione lyase family enzyme